MAGPEIACLCVTCWAWHSPRLVPEFQFQFLNGSQLLVSFACGSCLLKATDHLYQRLYFQGRVTTTQASHWGSEDLGQNGLGSRPSSPLTGSLTPAGHIPWHLVSLPGRAGKYPPSRRSVRGETLGV